MNWFVPALLMGYDELGSISSLPHPPFRYGYTPLSYADSNSRGHSPIYNPVETLDESDIYG